MSHDKNEEKPKKKSKVKRFFLLAALTAVVTAVATIFSQRKDKEAEEDLPEKDISPPKPKTKRKR